MLSDADFKGYWALCEWARDHDMRAEALEAARTVIAILPEHHVAAMFLEKPDWRKPLGPLEGPRRRP